MVESMAENVEISQPYYQNELVNRFNAYPSSISSFHRCKLSATLKVCPQVRAITTFTPFALMTAASALPRAAVKIFRGVTDASAEYFDCTHFRWG
jgi:hypothetical protein